MIADGGQESLECRAVKNVLARVQLKPNVNAIFVEGVQDGRVVQRRPSSSKADSTEMSSDAGARDSK